MSPVRIVGLYTFVKGQKDREFAVRSGHCEED